MSSSSLASKIVIGPSSQLALKDATRLVDLRSNSVKSYILKADALILVRIELRSFPNDLDVKRISPKCPFSNQTLYMYLHHIADQKKKKCTCITYEQHLCDMDVVKRNFFTETHMVIVSLLS